MINPNITGSLSISLKSKIYALESVERDVSKANPNNARDNFSHAIFQLITMRGSKKSTQQNPIMLLHSFAYAAFVDKPNNVLALLPFSKCNGIKRFPYAMWQKARRIVLTIA